jgi:hypothetical protein
MKVFAFVRSEAGLACGLAVLYLVLHLPSLSPSLEDIDSINFALALRDYDVAAHQPHPPGYPVYIALARAADAVIAGAAPGLPQVRREALALSVWSAIGGAIAIVAAWALFSRLQPGEKWWSVWAAALTAANPLFWMTGLRPMSDMTGLALALGSQALLLRGVHAGSGFPPPPRSGEARRSPSGGGGSRTHRRALVIGAALAGLAIGVRAQTALLTVPLLVVALAAQRQAGIVWLVTRPIAALVAAGLAWGLPLLAASGGVSGYLAALGTQAGEDFAWVDMLLFNPTPRRLAFGLLETFALPWDVRPGVVVLPLAALGLILMAIRERRALWLLAVAFAPYAVFHLLLQETFHIRYALPIVPAVAWLAARAVADLIMRQQMLMSRPFAPVIAALPILVAAWAAVPAGVVYGGEAHPAFRAIDAANAAMASGDRPAAVFSHFALRRPLQAALIPGVPYVEPKRSYEWLELVDYWVGGGRDAVWFFADPKRTDLALIDPQSRRVGGPRRLTREYRWSVGGHPGLGGVRPIGADWYRFNSVPGWFAAEGWGLTPETGGLAKATTMGVDREPIDAYVRRREGPMHLVVGVRHLGHSGEPATVFELTIDGVVIERWTLDPVTGLNALRFVDLPQGLPPGPGDLAHLSITARSAVDGRPTSEVAVRQFDIQPANTLIWGFGEGWHEAEYETASGLRWRWTSERSVLRVATDKGVRLEMRGQSPLLYVDTPPRVRVTAGGRDIAELRPSRDFMWTVDVAAADVARGGGAIAIETDQVYLPGQAEGTADARRLGLRLFEVQVNTGTP